MMRRFIDLVEAYGAHTPPEFERDDEEFYTARDETGFFGAQGAGCLILAKATGRMMLVRRSAGVEEPGDWGNCGGAHKETEAPQAAAERELYEETGYEGEYSILPLLVFRKGDFRYSNFLAVVPEEFTPELGWEADDFRWCPFGEWPNPLHFGVKAVMADAASVATIKEAISSTKTA